MNALHQVGVLFTDFVLGRDCCCGGSGEDGSHEWCEAGLEGLVGWFWDFCGGRAVREIGEEGGGAVGNAMRCRGRMPLRQLDSWKCRVVRHGKAMCLKCIMYAR